MFYKKDHQNTTKYALILIAAIAMGAAFSVFVLPDNVKTDISSDITPVEKENTQVVPTQKLEEIQSNILPEENQEGESEEKDNTSIFSNPGSIGRHIW